MVAWFLPALLACAGHIQEQYEAEKAAVLAAAPAASADWSPDIRVRIRPEGLQDISTAALDAGLLAWDRALTVDGVAGLSAELTPKARVTRLELSPGRRCGDCLSVTAALKGSADWNLAGVKGSLPFTAELGGVLEVALEPEGDQHRLRARLGDLTSLSVQVGELRRLSVDDRLQGWVKKAVQAAPAFTVATLGGDGLPLRAARLRIQPDAVVVDALSEMAAGAPVDDFSGTLEAGSDWEVRASSETVLAMMRVAAFQAGMLDYDVAIDPRSLSVADDGFTLGLRLWRLSGRGWWRDYTVDGRLGVQGRKLTLEAEQATEGDKSPGAGLADPLALLAEGRILQAITDNLRQAVPGSRTAAFGDVKVRAATSRFVGEGGAVVLRGTLQVQEGTGAAGSGGE